MNRNLRSTVLRGGAYMSVRMVLGLSISLGGLTLLTRAIGPENFGLYAAALGIYAVLENVTQGGIRAYLVRREGEERAEVYHQAFTLLLLFGTGGTLIVLLGLPLVEHWVRMDGFGPVALAIFLSLPVALLAKVPLACLERALDFKRVAMFELVGMLVYYVTALTLAFRGFGVAAPIAGWWAQQLSALVLASHAARYRPRLHWDRGLARDMVAYGLTFSASTLVFKLRELVNPLVVGRYLGAEAVGYVALAIRFVTSLSFVKDAAWRLSMPTFARLAQERSRLVRAVTEGMQLQLLVQGPLLVGFGWVALWLLPLAFDSEWLPAMEVYPFIALSYLINALFMLHSSALYALRRNLKVVAFTSVHVALFAGSAFLLVPSFGLVGYGLAEMVALASYAVIHVNFARVVGTPAYFLVGVWGAAGALALFVHELGWWAASGLALVALWPRTWRELRGYAKAMWRVKEA
jgi:O-antigen/teichoic acid export membrane protein